VLQLLVVEVNIDEELTIVSHSIIYILFVILGGGCGGDFGGYRDANHDSRRDNNPNPY